MPESITVPARVRVGFEAAPNDVYQTAFTAQDRQDFKTQVRTEIWNRIPSVNRDTWNSCTIDVPAGTRHLEESEVRQWLAEMMQTLTGGTTITLDPDPAASLVAARYTHWDKVRECEHVHRLFLGNNPWQVMSAAPAYTAQLCIQLAWDTPV